MSLHVLAATPSVFRLAPPYERVETVPDVGVLSPDELPDATVLGVHLPSPGEAWGEAALLVARLRVGFPAVAVVLQLGSAPEARDPDWARRAGGMGVRAVLLEEEAPLPRLRHALTDSTNLAEEVERWLPVRLPGLPPTVGHLVAVIFREAPRGWKVGKMIVERGHPERTVRTWFQRAGVPGPGKWLAVAHALRAALRLQAEAGASLLALAVECGYSDHSSFSRQCLRLFGVRPGAIRGTLGWEWLLDRWLRRAAVVSRAG
jgi:AraC-like DNA-binding protein